MEHDIVFSDEVYQTRFGVFPPFLPCVGQQLFGVADVSDRGVEPYIEHFALGTLYGNGNTPIQVAAHGTRLQAHVEPALALAINIGTPLLMVFQNPLAKPFLVFVQRQIPVLRLTHHGLAAADGTLRINQVRGAEAGAALLALVAVSAFGMAVGAFAGDVAVGKEGLGFFVVILHAGLFDEFSLIVQLAEEVGSRVVMRL